MLAGWLAGWPAQARRPLCGTALQIILHEIDKLQHSTLFGLETFFEESVVDVDRPVSVKDVTARRAVAALACRLPSGHACVRLPPGPRPPALRLCSS